MALKGSYLIDNITPMLFLFSRTACQNVPKQACQSVARQVCHSVPQEQCTDVPREVCENKCVDVWWCKECKGGHDDHYGH